MHPTTDSPATPQSSFDDSMQLLAGNPPRSPTSVSPKTLPVDYPISEVATTPLPPLDLHSEISRSGSSPWSLKPLRDRIKKSLRITTGTSLGSSPGRKHKRRDAVPTNGIPASMINKSDISRTGGEEQTACFAFQGADMEQHFSEVAPRIFVGLNLKDQQPSSLAWPNATQWGQWAALEFSHVVGIATVEEARTIYEFPDPFKPVRESTLDNVERMTLTVPMAPDTSTPGLDTRLTLYQLATAGEFLHHALEKHDACVLVSCAEGSEVDAMALVVCFLASYCSESAWQVSRRLDEDPNVRDVWKGVLSWQDVEYVQMTLPQ
ncbi:hypothetical protein BV25DRAFT_1838735 [Artomyces pyxidatus]|uniref:Uncharacterized protein n=1 Tax=Artomyces pyxidatus TaxID=48021 RepID=A0ACB8SZQ1_9AGAM|nr:hypothetical protein BV25DRAFT_1838735 [Artomyces pyxidatus]